MSADDWAAIGAALRRVRDGEDTAEVYMQLHAALTSNESRDAEDDAGRGLLEIDAALAKYRAIGPSGSIAIDLAYALRNARELIYLGVDETLPPNARAESGHTDKSILRGEGSRRFPFGRGHDW